MNPKHLSIGEEHRFLAIRVAVHRRHHSLPHLFLSIPVSNDRRKGLDNPSSILKTNVRRVSSKSARVDFTTIVVTPSDWAGCLFTKMHRDDFFFRAAVASLAISCLIITIVLSHENNTSRSKFILIDRAMRTGPTNQMLWDFEEGGPTFSDDAGENYNPVIIDDSVSRAGYPSMNDGWQRWGCAQNNVADMYPCSNLPGRGKLDVQGIDSDAHRR